jgi:Lsr2
MHHVANKSSSTYSTQETAVAQKVVTLLTDDITGREIPEGEGATFDFAFQGYTYSIDLDTKNSKKFRDIMGLYIEHARRTGKSNVVPLRRSGERRASDVDPGEVRTWAEENGYEVSPRGRIKAEIVEAYKTAHA